MGIRRFRIRVNFLDDRSYYDHRNLMIEMSKYFSIENRRRDEYPHSQVTWEASSLDIYYFESASVKRSSTFIIVLLYPKLLKKHKLSIEDVENYIIENWGQVKIERLTGQKPKSNNPKKNKTSTIITIQNEDHLNQIISYLDRNFSGQWRMTKKGLRDQLRILGRQEPTKTCLCIYDKKITAEKVAMLLKLGIG